MLNKIIDAKLLKFILVGVVNTFFGMGIMFALYNLAGASYELSSAANYICGSILSYFLNKYFTFQNKGTSLTQIIKFIINIAVCYLLAYGLAKPLIDSLLNGQPKKIRENVAMLVGAVLFTGLNYIGQRFFAFKEKK